MLRSKLEFGQILNLSGQNWNSNFDRAKLEFDRIPILTVTYIYVATIRDLNSEVLHQGEGTHNVIVVSFYQLIDDILRSSDIYIHFCPKIN